MTILRALVPVLALLAAGSAAATGDDTSLSAAERERLEKLVAKMPIERVKTTRELRERRRSEGRPVPLVEGRPGYLYRDALHIEDDPIRGYAPETRTPQGYRDVDGCVVVSFQIRPDGKTDQFEVVKAEPAGVFDKLALRAVYLTEYEPQPQADTELRHQKAVWFLVARPPRSEWSPVNEAVEADRNKRREQRRTECEAQAP